VLLHGATNMLREDAGGVIRTYRSQSQLMICVAAVVVFNAINCKEVLEGVDGPAALILRVAFAVGYTMFGLKAGFSYLRATPEGVRVSNVFQSFSLRWSEIERFEIGRWQLLPYVCLIRLKGGRTMHAGGIQESRWGQGSAEGMVTDLNAELAQRSQVLANV
jgi:hypothetical protein